MKISFELFDSNIVVVANTFNMSILNQKWLIDKNIFSIEDFNNGYTFSSVFAQVKSNDFLFTLFPERIQVAVKTEADDAVKLIISKISRIVKELPETPYSAVGFNYVYFAVPLDNDIKAFTRSLFFLPESPLCKNFNDQNARFGGYFSKDVLGSRLKLDVKPIIVPERSKVEDEVKTEKIQFSFNFHNDLADSNKPKAIVDFFKKWDDAKAFSKNIIESLRGE